MALPLTGYLAPDGRYSVSTCGPGGALVPAPDLAAASQLQFLHVDVFKNQRYNPSGAIQARDYVIPLADRSFDFVFLTSVFTHMYPADTRRYLREIARSLRPTGRLFSTWFLLNPAQAALAAQGRNLIEFRFARGEYRVRDESVPESAVALEEAVGERCAPRPASRSASRSGSGAGRAARMACPSRTSSWPIGDDLFRPNRDPTRPCATRSRGNAGRIRRMANINEHYLKLKSSYLFSEIARRVREFQEAHADAHIIRLGIGDVTQPLPPSVLRALHEAVDEMARAETLQGLRAGEGLRLPDAMIAKHDYGARGVTIEADEIFVSDGSKCDSGNIQEIFAVDAAVAIPDPVYPVYRRHQRDGRPHRDRRRRGRYDGSSTCLAPPTTASCRRCPSARWT